VSDIGFIFSDKWFMLEVIQSTLFFKVKLKTAVLQIYFMERGKKCIFSDVIL